jgi:hypothetical protein
MTLCIEWNRTTDIGPGDRSYTHDIGVAYAFDAQSDEDK